MFSFRSRSKTPRWARRAKYVLIGVVLGYLSFYLLDSGRCPNTAPAPASTSR